MYTPPLFMGRTIDYWLELENRAEELDVSELINELVTLKIKYMLLEKELERSKNINLNVRINYERTK